MPAIANARVPFHDYPHAQHCALHLALDDTAAARAGGAALLGVAPQCALLCARLAGSDCALLLPRMEPEDGHGDPPDENSSFAAADEDSHTKGIRFTAMQKADLDLLSEDGVFLALTAALHGPPACASPSCHEVHLVACVKLC